MIQQEKTGKKFGLWQVDKKGNIDYTGGHTYYVEAARVWEDDWVDHMSSKGWCNLNDFVDALSYARDCYKKNNISPMHSGWDHVNENSKKLHLNELFGSDETKEISGHLTIENTHHFEGPLGKILGDSLYDHGKSVQQLGWDIITAALIQSGDTKLVKLGLERMKQSERRDYYTG